MMKVLVGYPNEREEFVIVERVTGKLPNIEPVLTTDQLIELQQQADAVYADPALLEYAVRIASATRYPSQYGLSDLARYITYGASPRAPINVILAARALAFVRGRTYVIPQDVIDMVLDVFRHRMVLSYEAMSDAVTSDMLIQKILERIPVPVVPLQANFEIPQREMVPA
jgi:MoxR-like ATPase